MSNFNKIIKNISNYELPLLFDDYFLDMSYLQPNTRYIDLIFGQPTVIQCRGVSVFGIDTKKHISNYTWNESNPLIIPTWACESKEEAPLYKYFILDNWISGDINIFNTRFAFTNNLGEAELPSTITTSHRDKNNENKIALIISKGYFICVTSYLGRDNKYYYSGLGIYIDDLIDILGKVDYTLNSPSFGNGSSSGGYSGGSFDDSSDTIDIPQAPTVGVTNVGFVNVYKTSLNSLQNLGSELFPNFTPPQPAPLGSDVSEMLQLGFNNLVENIVNFSNMYINSNLINYVIDCHCLPITPPSGESERIKIGFKEFTQTANKVTSDYVDFDCGTLNIGEYYTNFIDYVGTRAKMYLPFIGFVDIQPEYFQSGALQVKYRFNIIDGSFMVYVISSSSKSQLKNSVIASYGGNACVHIPITGINYSNMISSVLNGATSIVSGHSKGQVAVNTALDTLASKPPMQSSNGYNATSAYLGIRYPYLIIEREVSNFSEKYTNEYGLPCNISKTINELSGFIQMDNIHLETLSCTDDEKTLIQNLLQNGIIV